MGRWPTEMLNQDHLEDRHHVREAGVRPLDLLHSIRMLVLEVKIVARGP